MSDEEIPAVARHAASLAHVVIDHALADVRVDWPWSQTWIDAGITVQVL